MRFMKNIREELGTIIEYIIGSSQEENLSSAIVRVIKSSLVEIRKRKTTEQSLASFDLPKEVLKMLY